MSADVAQLLVSFAICLARVSGVVAVTPIPGWKGSPREFRVTLSVALTLAMFPMWPAVSGSPDGLQWLGILLAEGLVGLILGCAVSFLLESLGLAAQLFGLQAGFSYASTIDPHSEADSGVLQVAMQLAGGLVFLSLGLDRAVIRSLGHSFQVLPPGEWSLKPFHAELLIQLGTEMWRMALRLALPIATLLLLLDLMLALVNRLQAHLQLLSLAFPVKLLASLLVLTTVIAHLPHLLRGAAELTFRSILP